VDHLIYIIKAPMPIGDPILSVFLAGSIEMGSAENWQERFVALLAHHVRGRPFTILNPRRDDWDKTWEQSIDNPRFREQVQWELDAMDQAGVIVMYFDPNTKSPITLLELGLYASSGKLLVCCPNGYWRKGNVDIVCARLGVQTVETLGALVGAAAVRLERI
jgi:hypothetical protein